MTKHNPWAGVGSPANDGGGGAECDGDLDAARLLTMALTNAVIAHRLEPVLSFYAISSFAAGTCRHYSGCVPGQVGSADYEGARAKATSLHENVLNIIDRAERLERPQGGEG